jgi:hypothetical protein
VAVVQISRIQVRRGNENTETGVPQLSGGELAWALDTQSLYIGNGSVAEGAPGVGNTKILTEADDLFGLATSYQYAKLKSYIATGSDIDRPVKRSLQNRLDDFVNVKAFGALGDGTTDDTVSIQRAIDQLFLNSADITETSRVTLLIPPGVYRLTSTIFLPPFTTIVGAGKEKTVIKQTANTTAFTTIDSSLNLSKVSRDDEQFTFPSTQSNQIVLDGMTIDNELKSTALSLRSCKDSVFKNLELKGSWDENDGDILNFYGISMQQKSQNTTTDNNLFDNITFSGYSRLVNSNDDVKDNRFNNCIFHNAVYGVVFGETPRGVPGSSLGPQNNSIKNSLFREIEKQALWVALGTSNISSGNSFQQKIGYNGGDASSVSKTSIIAFDNEGNDSVNDTFLRSKELGTELLYVSAPYVPEISGSTISQIAGTQKVPLGNTGGTFLDCFRLPGGADSAFEVDYVFSSNDLSKFTRSGTLKLVLNKNDLNSGNTVKFVDEYDYSGPTGSGGFEESIVFQARYDDSLATIFVEYFSSLLDTAQNLVYKVRVIS